VAGGSISGADITAKQTQLFDDSAHGTSIGSCGVTGSRNGFLLVRSRADIAAVGYVQVQCPLSVGERLGVKLVLEDVAAGTSVAPQTAWIMGPNPPALRVEAAPYFLRADRTLRLTYILEYQGSANVVCSLGISG
jgi:hypothetical protein